MEIIFRYLRFFQYGAPSRQRGRVCNLWLMLDLASAVCLGSESRETYDHTLMFQFGGSPKLEGKVPVLPQELNIPVLPKALIFSD
jgi:hypothetical protein